MFKRFSSCLYSIRAVQVLTLKDHQVMQVAAGEQHSVAVTSYGEVRVILIIFASRDTIYVITRVFAKYQFLIELLVHFLVGKQTFPQVYSWGDNTFGQTGIGGSEQEGPVSYPARNKTLAHLMVVQVTCGAHHTLALTSGLVFSFLSYSNTTGYLQFCIHNLAYCYFINC
jgi:hypothetical protein